jgi:undecaprenyl-diphosphatase
VIARIITFLRGLYAWARPRWAWLSLLFLGVLLPLAGFGSLAEDVEEGGLPWDEPILRWVHGHATHGFDRAAVLLSRLGYLWGAVPLGVGVLVLLLAIRHWRRARFFAIAAGGATLLNVLAKLAFHRVRPALWKSLAPETSYSFPSGHAMGTMALAAALVVITWPTRGRWWVLAAGSVFVLLVGLSRVYLGVHYPSDILAGWAASLAWVAGVAVLTYGDLLPSRAQARESAEGPEQTAARPR